MSKLSDFMLKTGNMYWAKENDLVFLKLTYF